MRLCWLEPIPIRSEHAIGRDAVSRPTQRAMTLRSAAVCELRISTVSTVLKSVWALSGGQVVHSASRTLRSDDCARLHINGSSYPRTFGAFELVKAVHLLVVRDISSDLP